jgi:Cu(I)/Ag(I) efflux system membrane fusion protein
MKTSAAWAALRIALVRLRFVALVAGAALVAAHLDDLEALVRRAARGAPPAAAATQGGAYACPMHPDAVRSEPGTCPACGMPLHRREAEEGVHLALGAERARLGGLAFARVERRPLERELTALATLELDDRRVARLATPLRAQVLAVRVAAPGAPVRRGEVLATLGARELAVLGRDLQRDLPPDDPTILLARQRLLQMGLSEAQVDRLRVSHQPTAFELLSPLDGILVARSAVSGDQVAELTPLFTVADVSRLWLVVRLPEEEALLAAPGTRVEAELLSAPGLVVGGRVAWQDAQVDPQTRTLAVRAEVDNPRGLLRPGMSGRARLRLPVGSPGAPPLVVPATAVVDTGLRQVVWREDEAGILEPAEVKLTARVGAFVAVASGLEEGDRVVAQGAFLLSADQRLRPPALPAPTAAPAPARVDRD